MEPSSKTARHGSASIGTFKGQLCTHCYAWAYICAVHYGYVAYIHPVFEYAHYTYLSFSKTALFSTYFLAWLPVVVYRSSARPAQAVAGLIYALSYVPIQLSLLFTMERPYDRLFWIQAMLALSMMAFFVAAKGRDQKSQSKSPEFWVMDWSVVVVSSMAVSLMIIVNRGHMRFISFADVYDLRFEAAAAPLRNVFSDYLTSWLGYCFTSYLFARGVIYRKWRLLLVGVACAIIIYMSEGEKAAILLLPLTLGMRLLWGSGQYFLSRLLLTLATLIAIASFAIPDEGVGVWIKAILLVRIVGAGGWLACKYLEFFPTQGLTYYSHISLVNTLTGIYPYGHLSLGQMIGLTYSGGIQANHNASFWASDGFAALGPIGILTVTPLVAVLLYSINKVTARIDAGFSVLWMCGFIVALLNVPLFTALISGGGMIIFTQAWWLSKTGGRWRDVRWTSHQTLPQRSRRWWRRRRYANRNNAGENIL